MNSSDLNQTQWMKRAGRLVRRVNAALVFEKWIPGVVIVLVLASAMVLLFRSLELSLLWVWWGAGGLALIWGGVLAWCLRGRFWGIADGLERLDFDQQLNGQLVAAADGIREWPSYSEESRVVLRWKAGRLAGPMLLALAILFAGIWVPLPERTRAQAAPTAPPLAWQETAELMEQLQESEILDPDSLDPFEEALAQLSERPPKEWYSHSSLEAGESLLADLRGNVGSLADSLAAAEQALSHAEAGVGEAAAMDLREALRGMEASRLGISQEMAEALRSLARSDGLRQISAAELKRLKIELGEACEGMGACLGNGLGEGKGRLAGFGEGEGDGDEPGRGGVTRGPGTAPLAVGDLNRVPAPGVELGLESDLSPETGLGEIVETRLTAPESEIAPFEIQQGGAVRIESGAEAVQRRPVTPAEQQILKRYFQ